VTKPYPAFAIKPKLTGWHFRKASIYQLLQVDHLKTTPMLLDKTVKRGEYRSIYLAAG